jgi:hypothetical protein
VWELATGHKPVGKLDHIDRCPRNNRLDNLRLASDSDNQRNMDRPLHNTSGYKGVSYYKAGRKWCAYITVKDRKIHLGYFFDILEAAGAYDRAALHYHGDFASTNGVVQ